MATDPFDISSNPLARYNTHRFPGFRSTGVQAPAAAPTADTPAPLAAGISTIATFNLDKRFGVWLRKHDPFLWAGYQAYGPIIAKLVRGGKLQWIAKTSPRCWAYEIAQRTGGDTSGFPRSIELENWAMRVVARAPARAFGFLKVKYDALQS